MNDTERDKTSMQNTDQTQQPSDELQGYEITQEQIRDVYFAGTSDGLVVLNKGKVVNIDEQSVDLE